MIKGIIETVRLTAVRVGDKIGLNSIGLFSHAKKNSAIRPALALETGFGFLLENGKRILIEKQGTKEYPPVPISRSPALALENGFSLLLESGNNLSLEIE